MNCQRCNEPIDPKMPWGKYCSDYCRKKTWKAKKRGFVNCVPRGQMKFMGTQVQHPVDSLDRMVSRPEIAALFGCSPMTVRRMETDPDMGFPRPVPLTPGLTRWRLSDVREFIKRRAGVAEVTT